MPERLKQRDKIKELDGLLDEVLDMHSELPSSEAVNVVVAGRQDNNFELRSNVIHASKLLKKPEAISRVHVEIEQNQIRQWNAAVSDEPDRLSTVTSTVDISFNTSLFEALHNIVMEEVFIFYMEDDGGTGNNHEATKALGSFTYFPHQACSMALANETLKPHSGAVSVQFDET